MLGLRFHDCMIWDEQCRTQLVHFIRRLIRTVTFMSFGLNLPDEMMVETEHLKYRRSPQEVPYLGGFVQEVLCLYLLQGCRIPPYGGVAREGESWTSRLVFVSRCSAERWGRSQQQHEGWLVLSHPLEQLVHPVLRSICPDCASVGTCDGISVRSCSGQQGVCSAGSHSNHLH